MKRARWSILVLLCAASGLVGGACAKVDAASAPRARGYRPLRLVEVFSWWYAPGEAEAVEALTTVHHGLHPAARVFNTAFSGESAGKALDQRLREDDPPDLFIQYIHDGQVGPATVPGKRKPLDGLFDKLGLRGVIFSDVVQGVTDNGHIYSMPVNVHRENSLFYNRKIFADHHLQPPTTLKELLSVCRTLKAAGVTPIATVYQGWILRTLFSGLAAAQMGSEAFHDYFSKRGPADIAKLREAVNVFADVLESYTSSDAGNEGYGWTAAAQALYNGDAAMFMHGDWVKGYLVQLGWNPDVDFGVVASPGATDLFLYGIDGFALPYGAKNEAGALDFLQTVVSPDGQAAFNRIKGSSPIRADIPRERLDDMGRRTMDDLEKAKIRMLVHFRSAWEDALAAFTKNHDRAALLKAFLDNPADG
jgi:glucose/mannose transport system substrate-binding protein